MPDLDAVWLLLAATSAVAGMGWLALAMPMHAVQVLGHPLAATQRRTLRGAGAAAQLGAFASCLVTDHVSMAVLVWVMLLAAAAVVVAFVLAGAPRGLRALVPWLRAAR